MNSLPPGVLCKSAGKLCVLCNAETIVGEMIFPLQSCEGGEIMWAHVSCHELATEYETPICRHWKRLGRCPMNENGYCVFTHPLSVLSGSMPSTTRKKWGGRR